MLLSKFTKRLILILPFIGFGMAVSIIILWTIMPPWPENDIPNWMTMTVEIGIGVFIAALIFILQEKTSGSLTDLVKKIDRYDEEQKKLGTIVRLRSLELIEGYLSDARDFIEFDMYMTSNEDEPDHLNLVESYLRSPYKQPLDTRLRIINQLRNESTFVRPYIVRIDLVENLKSIIDKMEILYGLSFFSFPRQGRKSTNLV
jgi:hypothetical protein